MLARIDTLLHRIALALAAIGGTLVVIQMLWTSYGVIMRYVFNNPDGTVTEATALLLFPVAFLGLAFALKEDAYPKVSFLLFALKKPYKRLLLTCNMVIMLVVGVFFSIAAIDATWKSFHSGSASEILLWPRYLFWAPGALAITTFTLLCLMKLITIWLPSEQALQTTNH